MNHLRMELKVCEGCGALWLRAGLSGAGSTGTGSAEQAPALRRNVYCKPCVRMFASFPAARGPKKNSRIRIRTRVRQPLALAIAGGAR